MQAIKPIVNNLKLRMGYGLSGNLGAIDSYNSLELVKPNGVVPVNGSSTVTLGIIRNANPDLKWEVKHTFNMGLDLGFWNNRLVVTADYYHSKTSDMLYMYNVTVPPYPYDKLLANEHPDLVEKYGVKQAPTLVLPTAVQVYDLILMLNFFRQVPEELEDAAP